MTDFIVLPRNIIEMLPTFSHEAVSMYLFLLDRGYVQKELGVGLSAAELARGIGVSYSRVQALTEELVTRGCIEIAEKGKAHVITVIVGTDKYEIPFTYKNTDETKIATLETEVRRLRLQNERNLSKSSSGLAESSQGLERDLYVEIENSRGYALTAVEGNLLGKCVQKFGPERTKSTYRQMRRAKNPVIATYASLQNGIKGQGAKQVESQPFVKVHYRELE